MALEAGNNPGDEPTRLTYLDCRNKRALLIQVDERSAQVVPLWHGAAPSIASSGDGASTSPPPHSFSTRSRWPLPSSRRICANAPSGQSTLSGRQSAISTTCSRQPNARGWRSSVGDRGADRNRRQGNHEHACHLYRVNVHDFVDKLRAMVNVPASSSPRLCAIGYDDRLHERRRNNSMARNNSPLPKNTVAKKRSSSSPSDRAGRR